MSGVERINFLPREIIALWFLECWYMLPIRFWGVLSCLLRVCFSNSFIASDGYTVLGNEEVMSKFGVKPSSLPDLFGLVGDVADNIPGKTFFFFLPSSHDFCLFWCFSCARALCYLELLPGVDVPVVTLVVFALFSF